jgi:hypothetical protein
MSEREETLVEEGATLEAAPSRLGWAGVGTHLVTVKSLTSINNSPRRKAPTEETGPQQRSFAQPQCLTTPFSRDP